MALLFSSRQAGFWNATSEFGGARQRPPFHLPFWTQNPPPLICGPLVCYHLQTIYTSTHHPHCCSRSPTCSPFHISPNIPPKTSLIASYTQILVYKCTPCPCDYLYKNMPHGAIRARLPTATPHRAESGSACQTGRPNREPRAPNPEVRAPGSTPTTLAWLWAPCAHSGRLEAAPSPTRGAQSDPSF